MCRNRAAEWCGTTGRYAGIGRKGGRAAVAELGSKQGSGGGTGRGGSAQGLGNGTGGTAVAESRKRTACPGGLEAESRERTVCRGGCREPWLPHRSQGCDKEQFLFPPPRPQHPLRRHHGRRILLGRRAQCGRPAFHHRWPYAAHQEPPVGIRLLGLWSKESVLGRFPGEVGGGSGCIAPRSMRRSRSRMAVQPLFCRRKPVMDAGKSLGSWGERGVVFLSTIHYICNMR